MNKIPHKWTNEENQFILDNYKRLSKQQFQEIFNVSLSSIMHKFARLGITEKSIMGMNYEWTNEEIQYLRQNWEYKQDKEIWKELGIDKKGFSHYVVSNMRRKLGLIGKSKRIRQDSSGYKYYINYNKRVYTHREKIEEAIGRKLLPNEIVHHIDLDKSNDEITNLYLCESNSVHQNIHHSLEIVAGQLVKQGIIKFDPDTQSYFLNDTNNM